MHTGIALVTGGEDRQWRYPAMTRGTDTNPSSPGLIAR